MNDADHFVTCDQGHTHYDDVMLKRCSLCGKSKDRSEFGKDRTHKDGLRTQCKGCRNDRVRGTRLAYSRAYNRRPEVQERHRIAQRTNKDQRNAAVARYELNHPERRKAKALVRQALNKGILTKLPCETCGDPNSSGHHPDYNKPLKVRWLCHKHHMEEHRKYD